MAVVGEVTFNFFDPYIFSPVCDGTSLYFSAYVLLQEHQHQQLYPFLLLGKSFNFKHVKNYLVVHLLNF